MLYLIKTGFNQKIYREEKKRDSINNFIALLSKQFLRISQILLCLHKAMVINCENSSTHYESLS